MKDDIIINKIETIKKCIKRVNEEYENDSLNLKNCTKQDSIILNIQRLCEAGMRCRHNDSKELQYLP